MTNSARPTPRSQGATPRSQGPTPSPAGPTPKAEGPAPNPRDERRRAMAALLAGPGLRLMVLAIGSLAAGGVIAIAARGFELTDRLVGVAVVGLLLLAPLPMLAGDATDALLIDAVRRRRLSADAYQRIVAWAVPGAVIVVGMLVYPVFLGIGGVDGLSLAVIAGAFVVFGVLPIGGWLLGRLRRPRSDS